MPKVKILEKRDGRKAEFNREKISSAIEAAMKASKEYKEESVKTITDCVLNKIEENYSEFNIPKVEEIQDIIEKTLIEKNYPNTAKSFILYRANRSKNREMKSSLMKIYEDLTFQDAKDNDLKRENANIDGDTAMGTMLKYGSEGAKKFNELFILKPEHSTAHISGDIHIHDLDFLTLTTTCCQIDLGKLLEKGFCTGHGTLRTPSNIRTASALACIVIQSNQNDQHGGQSIPAFDHYLAPYVHKSFVSIYKNNLNKSIRLLGFDVPDTFQVHSELSISNIERYQEEEKKELLKLGLEEKHVDRIQSFVKDTTLKEVDNETFQSMEALVHNLNTMNCFHEDQEVHTLVGVKDFSDIDKLFSDIEKEAMKNLLIDLYENKGMLTKEIASELKWSEEIVVKTFEYFGIKRRVLLFEDKKQEFRKLKGVKLETKTSVDEKNLSDDSIKESIYHQILETFPSLKIQYNVRDLIPGNKQSMVSIYFPDLKLAIDINSGYSYNKNKYFEDLAHGTCFTREAEKHDLLEKEGIQLLFLWKEDWLKEEAKEISIIAFNLFKRMIGDF